jgi:hypothetical protein
MITIEERPAKGLDIQDKDLVWVLSSTNIAQPNFRYLVEIPEIGYKKLLIPNPASRGMFNMNGVGRAERQMNEAQYATSTQDSNAVGGACKRYTLQFGEVYDVEGVSTEFPNLVSSDFYVIDGTSERSYGYDNRFRYPLFSSNLDRQVFLTDWVENINRDSQVLANQDDDFLPRYIDREKGVDGFVIPVASTDYGLMSFVNDNGALTHSFAAPGVASKIEYKIYDSNLVQSGATVYIDLLSEGVDPVSTNEEDKLVHIPIYPASAALWSAIPSGQRPSEFGLSDWYYYDITLVTELNGPASQTIKFIRRDICEDYTRVGWINEHGGYDYFNFTGNKEERINIARKQYNKVIGSYSASSFGYNSSDRGLTEYHNDEERVFTLFSEFLEKGEFEYLQFMFKSKQVAIIDTKDLLASQKTLTPVVVQDNTYQIHQQNDYRIFNIQVNLKEAR